MHFTTFRCGTVRYSLQYIVVVVVVVVFCDCIRNFLPDFLLSHVSCVIRVRVVVQLHPTICMRVADRWWTHKAHGIVMYYQHQNRYIAFHQYFPSKFGRFVAKQSILFGRWIFRSAWRQCKLLYKVYGGKSLCLCAEDRRWCTNVHILYQHYKFLSHEKYTMPNACHRQTTHSRMHGQDFAHCTRRNSSCNLPQPSRSPRLSFYPTFCICLSVFTVIAL